MRQSMFIAGLVLLIHMLGVQVLTAQAQTYPNRPIQLVIPAVAGATSDITGRLLAEEMEKILGTKERLADNPTLARSIRHRFPYIAPLNYIQAELIRRHRAGMTDAEIREGILMSINGVSAGLRNTG